MAGWRTQDFAGLTLAPCEIQTMADEQFTRCPGCKTVFRVTDAQLALRAGQVRCGHCRTVFNGRDELISLDPPETSDADEEVDELAQGPPTVTLRSARALDPPPPPEPEPAEHVIPAGIPAGDYENRFAGARGKKRSRVWTALGFVAIPVLVVALAAQAIFHFRDSLAARVPATRPALVGLCALAGCDIRPLRDVAALSIDASDLQADPAHRGLLVLTATVRNRAPYPVGYPHLELTLTDAQDRVVVRRALSPADYASGTADTAAGIPGNGEVPVRLFIDASATSQAGYRLYLFFP
jgi:predicted Zn finger-like uncharacterized protein